MPKIPVPPTFAASYLNCDKFPKNTILKETYGFRQLGELFERLISRAPELLVEDDETYVAVKDVLSSGEAVKRNLKSDSDISGWLGDIIASTNPHDPIRRDGFIAQKEDPPCRFLFLLADTVTSPLRLTLKSLQRILSYHQVTPVFLDFLDVYGSPSAEDHELRFSGFRSETCLQDPENGLVIDGLRRSGRRYMICYNLKTVVRKSDDETGPGKWKIRQAAIHHQFDVGSGTQLWLFGDPHAAMKDRMSDVVNSNRNHRSRFDTIPASFRSSLDVHLAVARWSTEGWKQHIQSLEKTMVNLTAKLICMEETSQIPLGTGDLFVVQGYEDKMNETVMVLESNIDNMESLHRFYVALIEQDGFPGANEKDLRASVKGFGSQLRELIYDTKMQVRRAGVLLKTVVDRKVLFIQLLQTQAGERAERLTSTMWRQAEKTSKEAIAMRIITVITLVYLPPTFVCTFFGTDVVKYQGDDGVFPSRSYSPEALKLWAAVSIPLMSLTLLLAYGWYKFEGDDMKKKVAYLEKNFPHTFCAGSHV